MQIYREAIDKGLEGVVACSTSISSIQGDTLCYRGYTIEDLVDNCCFEEVAYLLWNEKLPDSKELTEFRAGISEEIFLGKDIQKMLKAMMSIFPQDGHPMDFLRSAVSLLAFSNQDVGSNDEVANRRKALRLTAKIGQIVSAFERLRQGQKILEPQKDKSMAWNFLYTLFGKEPKEEWVKIYDTALILHADHELNCSAFSARVTASSLSDLHSAVVSAIGTLKGPLHGGANTAVMKMLRQIKDFKNVDAFIEDALSGKKKVMGIGHRVYKNGDPRAKILKEMSQKLTQEAGRPELFEMSVKIDQMMFDKKGLMPNVDFYSATVYDSMGIANDLFTPIFASSRIVGWCAHVLEQYANNRIYRPRGEYVGPKGLKAKG